MVNNFLFVCVCVCVTGNLACEWYSAIYVLFIRVSIMIFIFK